MPQNPLIGTPLCPGNLPPEKDLEEPKPLSPAEMLSAILLKLDRLTAVSLTDVHNLINTHRQNCARLPWHDLLKTALIVALLLKGGDELLILLPKLL